MGEILVHEFTTLDGVIDAPTWTFPFFNDTPKYVVSSTLSEATWRNSEVLGPYDPERIRRLKNDAEGDVYVSGTGPRLFPDGAEPLALSLAACEAYANGAVHLTNEPAERS